MPLKLGKRAGRYDVLIEAPGFTAIIEFKLSPEGSAESMNAAALRAISQIDERDYCSQAAASVRNVLRYKFGISCFQKNASSLQCLKSKIVRLFGIELQNE
ncbi:MAG: PD-(D/E)XK nuclease domain-containing protein [Clostridiales bacterium]|jgi:hypothetical protein|nr:PD-(D/E)XK nuclease domain-containing protein [Clostridiales bacterium]